MELVHEVGAAVGAAAAAGRGDAAAAGGGDQGVGRETQARIYKKNRCRCEKIINAISNTYVLLHSKA